MLYVVWISPCFRTETNLKGCTRLDLWNANKSCLKLWKQLISFALIVKLWQVRDPAAIFRILLQMKKKKWVKGKKDMSHEPDTHPEQYLDKTSFIFLNQSNKHFKGSCELFSKQSISILSISESFLLVTTYIHLQILILPKKYNFVNNLTNLFVELFRQLGLTMTSCKS